jgi:molybdopterin-guanine dinucleotide biosynthesis protein A
MIKNKMAAIILAGGKSTRMEEDKALLTISGLRLIEKITRDIEPYFQEIIISTSPETIHRYTFLPLRTAVDKESHQGPLGGILTGLQASQYPVNFVIACDIPEIHIPFLQMMMMFTGEYDIVVPVTGEDKFEPLFAFYHRRLIPKIRDLLKQGIKQVLKLLPLCRVKYIPMVDQSWFYNLNTMEDYERYMREKKIVNGQ